MGADAKVSLLIQTLLTAEVALITGVIHQEDYIVIQLMADAHVRFLCFYS